jgi:serine protease AprX
MISHKASLYILSLVMTLFCFQQVNAQEQYAYRISFSDKAATTYTLQTPQSYLSQRALERRQKYNIQIDSTDLPVCNTYIDSIITLTNGIKHNTSKWLNNLTILVTDTTVMSNIIHLNFVQQYKLVGYYANGLHEKPSGGSQNNENKPTDFDENFYNHAWQQIALCNGQALHQQGFMGEGMLIAIIDVAFEGVNTLNAFDSLNAHSRILDTWNFILDTAHVYDYDTHGTQTLSCMAAYTPNTYVGTAPKAQYVLYATDHLTTENALEEDNLVAALERSDSVGADIISISLGYNTFDNPADNYTYQDLDGQTTLSAKGTNLAVRKGMFAAVSAGNEGNTSWQKILTPGDADSALTVGSVNQDKLYTNSSGKGPNASNKLKPNVCAKGVSVQVISLNNNIVTRNGASYATPIIAGLAACLLQAQPQTTPYSLKTAIEKSCDSFTTPNNNRGYGVPDFANALMQLTNKVVNNRITESIFQVMPIPTQDKIWIYGKAGFKTTHITLTDGNGKAVLTETLKQNSAIDVRHLPSGVYYLSLVNIEGTQIEKVVIAH